MLVARVLLLGAPGAPEVRVQEPNPPTTDPRPEPNPTPDHQPAPRGRSRYATHLV